MYEFCTEYDTESRIFSISYAKQKDIDSTIFPEGVEQIHVTGDYFDKITIPDGVTVVVCVNVCLKEISLPKSIEYLYISDNKISNLVLPQNIKYVVANNNILTSVSFVDRPTELIKLDLMHNRISTLSFIPPPSMVYLNIYGNPIEKLSKEILEFINNNEDAYYLNPPMLDN